MPSVGIIFRKIFGIFLYIGTFFKYIYGLCFRRRSSNIAELPFQIEEDKKINNNHILSSHKGEFNYF